MLDPLMLQQVDGDRPDSVKRSLTNVHDLMRFRYCYVVTAIVAVIAIVVASHYCSNTVGFYC